MVESVYTWFAESAQFFEILKVLIPLLAIVLPWFLNELAKRRFESYQRKEASYRELLGSLHGFYAGEMNTKELRNNFLRQFNLAWLYCPDEVIRKGYKFLETVKSEEGEKNTVSSEQALGEFILAIRKDLMQHRFFWSSTLKADEFQILSVSKT